MANDGHDGVTQFNPAYASLWPFSVEVRHLRHPGAAEPVETVNGEAA
jgi:hypothetical protein